MLFLDDFREVPELWRPAHVLGLLGIMDGFHVFKGIGSVNSFLIMSVFSWKHALPDDGVFNILLNSLIDMLKFFNCRLNDLILKIVITIILPNPISTQLFSFLF